MTYQPHLGGLLHASRNGARIVSNYPRPPEIASERAGGRK